MLCSSPISAYTSRKMESSEARLQISEEKESFEDLIADLENSKVTIEKEEEEIRSYREEIEKLKNQLEAKQEKLNASREKISPWRQRGICSSSSCRCSFFLLSDLPDRSHRSPGAGSGRSRRLHEGAGGIPPETEKADR